MERDGMMSRSAGDLRVGFIECCTPFPITPFPMRLFAIPLVARTHVSCITIDLQYLSNSRTIGCSFERGYYK